MLKMLNRLIGRMPAAGSGRLKWLFLPGGLTCAPFDDEDEELIQIPYRSSVMLETEIA